jgi:hypothetical protein
MNENTVTEEVISGLLDACLDNNSAVQIAAMIAIENIFPLCLFVPLFAHDTVLKILSCVNRFNFKFMREIPPEKFVQYFLQTEVLYWVPIIKTVLLRQGYGITVTEKTVVLYSSKDPLELPVPSKELSEQLKSGLISQPGKSTEIDRTQATENLNQSKSKSSSDQKGQKRSYPFRPS